MQNNSFRLLRGRFLICAQNCYQFTISHMTIIHQPDDGLAIQRNKVSFQVNYVNSIISRNVTKKTLSKMRSIHLKGSRSLSF